MREAHLAHLAQVARAAGREAPEVAQKFVFRPGTTTYVAFQTTARAFLAEAEAHRELLVRHGLVESVLAELRQSLDQFDAAMVSGAEARAAHVRASAELRRLADEVVQGVKVLDRFNRVRFRGTPEVLAAWRSVSNLVATPRGTARLGAGSGRGVSRRKGAKFGRRHEGYGFESRRAPLVQDGRWRSSSYPLAYGTALATTHSAKPTYPIRPPERGDVRKRQCT
jgi:hypothetical protein